MAQINANFLTPVEAILRGGTPNVYDGKIEFDMTQREHHTPQYLLKREKTLEEVTSEREKWGIFTGDTSDIYAGVSVDNPWRPVLKLQLLNPAGETLEDPKIVVLIHQETGEVRDLDPEDSERETLRMYKKYAELQNKHDGGLTELHLREPWASRIGEYPGKSPENRG